MIKGYVRRKDYLICVDSDGCAMDTMDIKHRKCFGPCLVEVWGLEKWREVVLKRWNEINLYSRTRGINRFKALAKILREINDNLTPIEGLERLEDWVKSAKELSNAAIRQVIAEEGGTCLENALTWSEKLNERIESLSDGEKLPFDGVLQTLEKLHAQADVAVISSANGGAVKEEWTRCRLIEHTDALLTQEYGSKARCIGELKNCYGYDGDKILMVGDAVGDYNAARENGVLYFPVLVGKESQSWSELGGEGLERLLNGTYSGAYSDGLYDKFIANFADGRDVP